MDSDMNLFFYFYIYQLFSILYSVLNFNQHHYHLSNFKKLWILYIKITFFIFMNLYLNLSYFLNINLHQFHQFQIILDYIYNLINTFGLTHYFILLNNDDHQILLQIKS